MKAVLFLTLMITSGLLFAQNTVEQSVSAQGFSFIEHFKQFSWAYIAAFVGLVGLIVVGYLFGWDKKLFKHKPADDNHQLFI